MFIVFNPSFQTAAPTADAALSSLLNISFDIDWAYQNDIWRLSSIAVGKIFDRHKFDL